MIFESNNQAYAFPKMLLSGVILGGIYFVISKLIILLTNDKKAMYVTDIVFGGFSAIYVIKVYLTMVNVKYRWYMPISFAVGFFATNFVLREIVENLAKLVYNIKEKRRH